MSETSYQQRKDYQLKYEHQINEQIERKINLETKKANLHRQQIKQTLAVWLDTSDTKYHLTLSFPVGTNEIKTKELLNQLIKHLNRSIYKKRYDTGQSYIEGFAIREPTPSMNTDHYHILMVDDGWLPDYKRMDSLISKQVEYLQSRPTERVVKRNFISSHLLQEYYNKGNNGLENYLLKQIDYRSNSIQKVNDSIGTLGKGNVLFGRERFDG